MEIHPPQVMDRPQPLIDRLLVSLHCESVVITHHYDARIIDAFKYDKQIGDLHEQFKQAIREVIERGCDPYGDGWEPEPPVDPDTFRQSPDENLEMARRYDLSSKDNLETRIEIRDSILRELFGEETE